MTQAGTARARPSLAATNLRLLLCGQAVSIAGSEITKLAIPLFALSTLHVGAGETGMLRAAGFAPALVLTPLVGVWVDRMSRRGVLAWTSCAQAGVLAVIAGTALGGDPSMPVLVAGVAALGILAQFGEVAYPSLVPTVVGEGDLGRANGRLFGVQSVAETVGPGLAGVLLGWLGLGWVLVLDAISFLVAAATVRAMRVRETVGPRTRRRLREDIATGLRVTLAHPLLRATVLTAAAYNVLDTAATTAFLVHATTTLHMSVAQVGLVVGGAGAGAVIGSLLSGRICAALGVGRTMTAALAAGTLVPLGLLIPGRASTATLLACAAVFVVWAFCITVYSVQGLSIRQAATPDRLLGRVMAGSWVFILGALPVGALLGGAAGDAWGARTALAVTVCALPSVLLILLTSPVPALRGLPAVDERFWRDHD